MAEREQSDQPLPISLFDYELPEELIAQQPLKERSASRLLVLERDPARITHSSFNEIDQWLHPGDLLVMNNTRVFPARLMAQRATGGRIELLLLQEYKPDHWEAMARPARRLREDEELRLLDSGDDLTDHIVTIQSKSADGTVKVHVPDSTETLEYLGRVPLPSYISESLDDPDRYQTVYAESTGSVAAPTAGLHFTPEILRRLSDRGIDTAHVTLHVGPGTFQPVKVEDAKQHRMHAERYYVSSEALRVIRDAKINGRRIVAVGTTSCRTLETIADRITEPGPISGETSLYITPGFEYRLVGALLTNFHLPKSTLLLLVSAFAGRELVLRSYQEAIAHQYRFYSFGDAMLVL
jgi:S-adenosylmethionine:tRNA ribosyltransferase-isomerase